MNVKHPKFECHVTSLCQGLRHSAGSGGADPENQVDCIHDTVTSNSFITYQVSKLIHYSILLVKRGSNDIQEIQLLTA